MTNQKLININFFLGGLVMFSLLLFPDITIKAGFPKFKFVDFLLPFIGISLVVNRKKINWNLLYNLILVFFGYILFVILYNKRQGNISDYFELYKLLKYLAIILLFTQIDYKKFFVFSVKPTFVLVVIGNLIHYFELLGLNTILEEHYDGGIHIQLFGLNSLGLPDMKRMVGFAGNPNINSIVFGFFLITFFPKKGKSNLQFLWFFVSIFMFFLCQSRTNFIALVVVMLVLFFWYKKQLKFNLIILGVVLISFLISFYVSTNSYINLLFDKKIVHNNSLLGRFEVWRFLWESIKEKPIFGHAPYKEFFYDRNLYSENEFILQTWRYGFVGLFIFLGVLLMPIYSALKNRLAPYSFTFVMFAMFMLINSLTNNPFTNPTINLIFGITIGFYYGNIKTTKQ